MIADSVCAWVMFARFGGPKALKTVSGTLSALLYMCLLCSFPAFIIGFNIGENTVVQSVPSPDGKQVAQVIDSDDGALGGDTFVDVSRGSTNLLLLCIEETRRVYIGEWGEFNNMRIVWRDDDTLLINGRSYDVP
jgi:hypothetical protein